MTSLDIIVPFWGDVDYLKRAVCSILRQTDPDWRLIVVDDAYPDEQLASWFVELNDPRVVYSRNAVNLGANANYRHALTLTHADYVVLMGADDLLQPGYVSHMREVIARHPDVAVIQPGVEVVDSLDRPTRPIPDRIKRVMSPRPTRGVAILSGDQLGASLLRANWTYFPSLCWNRNVVIDIGFREGLHVVQDLALLLDVCANGGSLALTPTRVFSYRRHHQSDSSLKALDGRRFAEERAFFELMREEFAGRGWTRASRAARWHVTSRLHAMFLLPQAVRARNLRMVRALGRHVVAL